MVDFSSMQSFIASLELGKYFLNPKGLYALAALIPLILFYLIKPKPRDKVIPSLMFILTKDENFLENSFFRKLLQDLLFFFQFMIITLLAVSVAMPYIIAEYDVSAQDTVLVVDISASMNAMQNGVTRLDRAKTQIREYLSDKNTLVFASDLPELAIKDGSRSEADSALSKAFVKDTGTNLGDAIQFAADQLKDKKGRIVVFSDFINSETDPVSIKKVLESKDVKVSFIDLSLDADNIGIIDLNLADQNSAVFIKNYNDKDKEIDISVAGISQRLVLPANSVESISFTTPKGLNKIEILSRDDFPNDNVAYISTPSEEQLKILFISNFAQKSNLYYALAANPKNHVETAVPPIVPNVNHDVYVLQGISKDLLLPETLRKISEGLDKGSLLVIVGQQDIFSINLRGLLPVQRVGEGGEGYVKIEYVNQFTKDVEFGKVHYFHKIEPNQGSVQLASLDENNDSLIIYTGQQKGKIVYYNIDDARSEFKGSITYPLFWNNMLNALINRESIASLNFKSGQSISGKRLESAGFLEAGSRTIAVNLLNDRESDVGQKSSLTAISEDANEQRFKTKRDTPLDDYLIVVAIILLFLEFLYIKIRGDL